MLHVKKDIKSHSEKYVLFDFEGKLDPTTNKHIVNYCIAHYFTGEERKLASIDDFCT